MSIFLFKIIAELKSQKFKPWSLRQKPHHKNVIKKAIRNILNELSGLWFKYFLYYNRIRLTSKLDLTLGSDKLAILRDHLLNRTSRLPWVVLFSELNSSEIVKY